MLRFRLWYTWALMPRAMRGAGIVASLVVFASSALLYQTNVRADRGPEFGRGGAFAGDLTDPSIRDLSLQTPVPNASARSRSSATLTAPRTPGPGEPRGPNTIPFPVFGRYVYDVDGYEQATAFGRRDYAAQMTTTVHRTQPTEPNVPRLRDDEVIFDLYFSDDHEEREIVAFRGDGIVFTYEAGSVTFGFTQTSEATYDPPMLQIPVPLSEGTSHTGTSVARDASGNVTRTEDWTVSVLGREDLDILGETVPTWVVQIQRQSQPGSSERVTRTRKYWFDTERVLWVKWEEQLNGSQNVGPGSFAYSTRFTATLNRIEPL
ncbi:MAG: hypothetical protein ACRDKJ_00745 [Actinomycetota bacterium]